MMLCRPCQAKVYGVLAGGVALGDSYLTQEQRAGIRLHAVNLGWNLFEPRPGVESTAPGAYIDQKKAEIARLKAAGFQIVLEIGIVDAPAWVRDPTHFEAFQDQDGNTNTRFANGIWDERVRDRIAHYIKRVFRKMGTDFYAIRVGSACHVEVQYPTGKDFQYWAFGPRALAYMHGVAPRLYACYRAGRWKPGSASNPLVDGGRRASDVFYDKVYLGRLRETVNWETSLLRHYGFRGKAVVLCPGMGVIGTQGAEEGYGRLMAFNLVPPTTFGCDQAASGGCWDHVIPYLADPARNLAVECSSFGEPQTFRNDDAPDPIRWHTGHWIGAQADKIGYADKWAENPGYPDAPSVLPETFRQINAFGYSTLCWAFESLLFAPDPITNPDGDRIRKHATLADYQGYIRGNP